MNTEALKPYNLQACKNSSENFFQKLSEFTDYFLLHSYKQCGELQRKYTLYAKLHPNDALLDLLITGVLFNTYANRNFNNLRIKGEILSVLYKLRKINPTIKKISDSIRGSIAYKWLGDYKPTIKTHEIQSIDYLIRFLKATSEYSEEIIRIQKVNRFLKSFDKRYQADNILQITELAKSFEKSAGFTFNIYTNNVETFWKSNREMYIRQENYFFCSKKPVEYHLNMVGAELMNRALRPTFNNTKNHVILVPTCMSISPNCQKKSINGELTCTQCNINCNVNRISTEFASQNTKTVLIPHSSKFSQYLKPWQAQKETGLIGVACVLNLLKGGFEMKRLNIPSQCIFLDFSGCLKHWHTGIATSLSNNKLKAILNDVGMKKNELKIA